MFLYLVLSMLLRFAGAFLFNKHRKICYQVTGQGNNVLFTIPRVSPSLRSMSGDDQEEKKRQLQKLLREYEANAGMAGFVCGRPVEFMPEEEQDRIIKGFCTPGNLQILEDSCSKLLAAQNESYAEKDAEKIKQSVKVLKELHSIFSEYREGKLSREEMRARGRSLLDRPIPEAKDELIESLSGCIEAVNFLSSQPIVGKDSWDQMIDCAQLHNALSRTTLVCQSLLALISGESSQAGAIGETSKLAEVSVEYLEAHFRGEKQAETLNEHCSKLYDAIRRIWEE